MKSNMFTDDIISITINRNDNQERIIAPPCKIMTHTSIVEGKAHTKTRGLVNIR